MKDVLRAAGLSVQFVLDAADDLSAPAGTQLWADNSGNGQSFTLGANASVSASDPTQVGTPGSLTKNTYFSLDGGDYFSNAFAFPTWGSNIHKALAKFSGYIWVNASAGLAPYLSTKSQVATAVGFSLQKNASEKLALVVGNGSTAALSVATTASITASVWTFLGWTMDEAVGANGVTLQINATQEQFTSTYTTPSATDATAMRIAAYGNSNTPVPAGHLIGAIAASDTYWGATTLNAIYNATKGRYA